MKKILAVLFIALLIRSNSVYAETRIIDVNVMRNDFPNGLPEFPFEQDYIAHGAIISACKDNHIVTNSDYEVDVRTTSMLMQFEPVAGASISVAYDIDFCYEVVEREDGKRESIAWYEIGSTPTVHVDIERDSYATHHIQFLLTQIIKSFDPSLQDDRDIEEMLLFLASSLKANEAAHAKIVEGKLSTYENECYKYIYSVNFSDYTAPGLSLMPKADKP